MFSYTLGLFEITDKTALAVGTILSVLIMITRMGSILLTKGMTRHQKRLVNAVFARG